MFLSWLSKYREMGLLILRVGVGLAMMGHGIPKLLAGPERWGMLGGAMGNLGITFAPQFWGFMAAVGETLGGLLFAIGFLFRPALILFLIPVMVVALTMHISQGDSYAQVSHPLKLLFVFVAFLLIGPGRYSVDEGILAKRGKY